jgi:hypothetical protein
LTAPRCFRTLLPKLETLGSYYENPRTIQGSPTVHFLESKATNLGCPGSTGIRKLGNPPVTKETFKITKDPCLPSCLRLVIGENDNPKFSNSGGVKSLNQDRQCPHQLFLVHTWSSFAENQAIKLKASWHLHLYKKSPSLGCD